MEPDKDQKWYFLDSPDLHAAYEKNNQQLLANAIQSWQVSQEFEPSHCFV